jgi:hypothetical protein
MGRTPAPLPRGKKARFSETPDNAGGSLKTRRKDSQPQYEYLQGWGGGEGDDSDLSDNDDGDGMEDDTGDTLELHNNDETSGSCDAIGLIRTK